MAYILAMHLRNKQMCTLTHLIYIMTATIRNCIVDTSQLVFHGDNGWRRVRFITANGTVWATGTCIPTNPFCFHNLTGKRGPKGELRVHDCWSIPRPQTSGFLTLVGKVLVANGHMTSVQHAHWLHMLRQETIGKEQLLALAHKNADLAFWMFSSAYMLVHRLYNYNDVVLQWPLATILEIRSIATDSDKVHMLTYTALVPNQPLYVHPDTIEGYYGPLSAHQRRIVDLAFQVSLSPHAVIPPHEPTYKLIEELIQHQFLEQVPDSNHVVHASFQRSFDLYSQSTVKIHTVGSLASMNAAAMAIADSGPTTMFAPPMVILDKAIYTVPNVNFELLTTITTERIVLLNAERWTMSAISSVLNAARHPSATLHMVGYTTGLSNALGYNPMFARTEPPLVTHKPTPTPLYSWEPALLEQRAPQDVRDLVQQASHQTTIVNSDWRVAKSLTRKRWDTFLTRDRVFYNRRFVDTVTSIFDTDCKHPTEGFAQRRIKRSRLGATNDTTNTKNANRRIVQCASGMYIDWKRERVRLAHWTPRSVEHVQGISERSLLYIGKTPTVCETITLNQTASLLIVASEFAPQEAMSNLTNADDINSLV